MSNRTSQADRAVRLAWKNEQRLVGEGKGTRDWTPDQQKDILTDGVAKDENDVVFRGHHMQSVELFPQYQGEPGNIQFLSAEEHLKAHDGWFRNLTNWYYNPVTGEKEPFEDGFFRPCEIIYLSEPVCSPIPIVEENTDSTDENNTSKEEFHKSEHKDSGKATVEQTKPKQEWQEETPELTSICVNTGTLTEQNDDDFDERIRDDDLEDLMDFDISGYLGYTSHENDGRKKKRGIVERIGDIIEDFKYEHPALSGFLMGMGQAATEFGKQCANDLIDDAINSHAGESNDSGAKHTSDAVPSVRIDIPDEDATGPKRSTPREHDVREYTRKRFGKTEIVRKHISPKPTNDESEE